ncbi:MULTISPECIES: hypothetical protein [Methylobacterium]|jgi:hypothetical protein|uniref:Uncharacterized protein n=1 Tax=Methylobacterium longum TaxID=767694 RepID=A0ABT8AN14_9HYPH|nr:MULTISPECIES: hypothetical protein [Methylobacterium]MCJ2103408.1 hypothetical protein [Methylobacterium sp. E-046]MDN3571170.1 hypothetical protein [Methylobacterium longum]GJE09016.1 hypothetical protein FOHLNKBM_0035 [Methylobacterium longum]
MRDSIFGLAATVSILVTLPLAPSRAAERGSDRASQRLLDDMTRHDLCARDDKQLQKLSRSLAGGVSRQADAKRAR